MASTTNKQRVAQGAGMFNLPKTTFSRETQELLKVMMQESKLTNFQQRHLKSTLKSGHSLPLRCNPTSSRPDRQTPPKRKSGARPRAPARQGLRSKDTIHKLVETSGDDEYRPLPTGYDSSKEKAKLQNVMAFGSDLDGSGPPSRVRETEREEEGEEEVDRFEEVVREIEERKQFLDDMAALGQDKPHRNRIMTEISQRVRDLKEIDQARCSEMLHTILQ